MVRQPSWNKTFLKKGTWSSDEDQKLIAYIMRYGIWNWNEMPKYAGLSRSGKSCRLRWMNYLRPNIKRGNFTREEEETIVQLQKLLGNRWSAIAARLPQRTDNDIKNYWNTRLKKTVVENNSASATTEIITSGIDAEMENSSGSDSSIFLNTLLDFQEPATYTFSSPADETCTTMEDNLVSSEIMYWEMQSFVEKEVVVGLEKEEDCEAAMSPNPQLWLHEPIHIVCDSYYDPVPVNDFWVNPFI